MNKLFKLLALSLSLVTLLAACGGEESASEVQADKNNTNREELVLAVGAEPDGGFDPTTGWGLYGSPLFQSTLLKYDPDFALEYDLAKNYKISEDGSIWTVEIRTDALFSDGEALAAEDVVFTFETAKKSGSIIDLSNLKSVEAIEEHIVQFTLNKPQSTFIDLLITTGIVPKHAYDDTYNSNPIGSGPYQLQQWDKGQQIIVTANPHYYGEKPVFNKLTFLFLTEDTTFAAAKAGEIDVASMTTLLVEEDVAGMNLIGLETVDNRGVMFPFLPAGGETTEGYPIGNDVTADRAIRQAINIAIDRQALIDGVLQGFGTPAYSVADQLPWWNEATEFEDARMEEAGSMLDAAGWIMRDDGVREKAGLSAEFQLIYPSGDQVRQSLSMAFADMIASLGIRVVTRGHSWNEIEKLMFSNPVMMGWGSYTPLEMYYLHSSETQGSGLYNANYYENPVVDNYIAQALNSHSQQESYEYWKLAQWDGKTGFSAQGDAPWAWLVNIKHFYLINEDLEIGKQKIQPHGHGWPVTDFIEHWHWKEQE